MKGRDGKQTKKEEFEEKKVKIRVEEKERLFKREENKGKGK